jgi:hypothetical protein
MVAMPSGAHEHRTWQIGPWSGLGIRYLAGAPGVVVIVVVAAVRTQAILIGGLIAAVVLYAITGLAIWAVHYFSERAITESPVGTLFAGRGWVPVESLRPHARFASFSVGRKVTVPVRVIINRTALTLQPMRSKVAVGVTVSWPEVKSLIASREVGKATAGSLTTNLLDGAQLRVGVTNYRGLAQALTTIRDATLDPPSLMR